MAFLSIAVFRATEYQETATRQPLVLFSKWFFIGSFLGMKMFFLDTLKMSWGSGKHIASYKHQWPLFSIIKDSHSVALVRMFLFVLGRRCWVGFSCCLVWKSQWHREENYLSEIIDRSMKRKVSEPCILKCRFNHLITDFTEVVNKLLSTTEICLLLQILTKY